MFHGQEEAGTGMVKSAKRRVTWAFAFGACPTANALALTHSVLTGGKTVSLDGRVVAEVEGSVAADPGGLRLPRACVRACVRACGRAGVPPARGGCGLGLRQST